MEKKTTKDTRHSQPETLLTTQQAAWLMRVSPKTLARMRMEGRGPCFVKIGRSVRYRQSDLLGWISANTYGSTSEF